MASVLMVSMSATTGVAPVSRTSLNWSRERITDVTVLPDSTSIGAVSMATFPWPPMMTMSYMVWMPFIEVVVS